MTGDRSHYYRTEKENMIVSAMQLAEKHGLSYVTRATISQKVCCAPGLVNYYWSTMAELYNEMYRRALAK